MRYVKEFAVVLALLMLAGCAGKPVQESPVATDEGIPAGQIYLYGEIHGIAAIEEYEAERWKECYERGMRHLFVELSHYTAQWLNLWMDAEDDEILEQLHQDWESTLSSGAETLDFYRTIKEQCPETVFHGTDVGHQYDSTGARYQDYLEERGLADTEDYRLTLETAHSIIQRSVEMAAIICSGSADLRDDLMEDAAYRYYFEKADALEE